MTTRRFYSNTATQQQLATGISSSATSLSISGSFSGWSSQFPFFATLDIGQASEEVVSVTNVVGTTATIVRGQDGTTALSHAAGATFDQTVVRQDLDEANQHTSSNSGVHGLSGNVVGTTDSQVLTNKTLTNPTINGFAGAGHGSITGDLSVSGIATVGTATVTGNETVAGTLNVTGATTLSGVTNNGNSSVTGNLTVGGTLGVTGVLTATAGIVDGTDTGWLSCTAYQSGWVDQGFQVRQVGGVVYFRGYISNSTFSSGTMTTACSLPARISAPSAAHNLVVGGSSTSTRAGQVDTSRHVQMAVVGGGASGAFFSISGSYPVG